MRTGNESLDFAIQIFCGVWHRKARKVPRENERKGFGSSDGNNSFKKLPPPPIQGKRESTVVSRKSRIFKNGVFFRWEKPEHVLYSKRKIKRKKTI